MSDVLYGFDSGLSLSFVHKRIGRAVTGFFTGGLVGAGAGFLGGGNGKGTTVPGGTLDRCGNPLFEPGEPESVTEARFRCANPVRVTVTPGAVLPGGEPLITVGRGNGAPAAPPPVVAAGFVAPVRSSVAVDKCPRFADGATGILWMSALTGQVVCLPRRANGTAFGLIRKHKPRRKPFISAAQKKQLDAISKVQNKAKAFATAAGFKCVNTKHRVPGTPKKKS